MWLFKKKDKKKEFWNWFVSNKSELEKFIKSDNRDYAIYKQLTSKLQEFNTLLAPEITIDKDDNFVLIITPDGIKKGIEPTEEIVDAAPHLDNWIVKKFRQPSDRTGINFKGFELDFSDIKILRKFDLEAEHVNIAVCIKDYDKNDKRYLAAGFLCLDHILGEFNVLTRVNEIDFTDWKQLDNIESIDLLTLRKEIEDYLY